MTSPSPSRSPVRIPPPGARGCSAPPPWSSALCTLSNPGSSGSCDACDAARPVEFDAGDAVSGAARECSAPPAWTCARCTLSNLGSSGSCDACGAARFVGVDADDALDLAAIAGAPFLPLLRCSRKRNPAASPDVAKVCSDEGDGAVEEDKAPAKKGKFETHLDKKTIKIMTYNVWFREDIELHRRMDAIGDLIRYHSPDFICFQEVTPYIYLFLQKSDWWQEYKCLLSHEKAMRRQYYCMQMSKLAVKLSHCIPFANSIMGRELCVARTDTGQMVNLVIVTSHLENPCPAPPRWDQTHSKERIHQANEALRILEPFSNAIFCGDMNWDDEVDGPFPLQDGWVDAWVELKPGEKGCTYDTKANGMLSGNRKVQKRLDRFVCRLDGFKIDSIEMIGKEAIPGVIYYKDKVVGEEVQKLELPVFPSDHFGLVLTVTRQDD